MPLPPFAPPPSYNKLSEKELLQRLLAVCQMEKVAYTPEGLEAVVFTADGDMRQALNNVQARLPCRGRARRGLLCVRAGG